MVFTFACGMGPKYLAFYNQLTTLLAEKRGQSFATVSAWIRTKLTFALLRSALIAVLDTRNRFFKPTVANADIDS